MHTCTLSLQFAIKQLPSHITVLRPRLTHGMKITNADNYYELKVRMCADDFRMITGLDYDLSYAPVIDGDIISLMIAVGTSLKLEFYFLDISNAFQSNVVHDPTKQYYMHILALYM